MNALIVISKYPDPHRDVRNKYLLKRGNKHQEIIKDILQGDTLMMTNRDKYLDDLKFIAAMLVIVGHSIQYSEVLNINKGFEFIYLVIYSFHMPLFALISGFLLYKSIEGKGAKYALKGKCVLLIPIIIYSIPVFFTRGVYAPNDGLLLNIRHFMGFVMIGNGLIWFLTVIFICSVLLIIISRVKYSDILIILSTVSSIVWFRDYFIALISFIYVFCSIGFMCAKYGLREKTNKSFLAGCSIVYIGLLLFYKREYLIYNGEWGIIGVDLPLKALAVDLFRVVIGFAGCMTLFGIVNMSRAEKSDIKTLIVLISRNTLGMYCISNLVYEYATPYFREMNAYLVFGCLLFISAIISVLFCAIFDKNRYLRMVFLGH